MGHVHPFSIGMLNYHGNNTSTDPSKVSPFPFLNKSHGFRSVVQRLCSVSCKRVSMSLTAASKGSRRRTSSCLGSTPGRWQRWPPPLDGASSLWRKLTNLRHPAMFEDFDVIMGIMEQHEYVETIIIYICVCVCLFIMHIQPLNYSHKVPPLNSLSPSLHLRERSHRLNYPPLIWQYPQMVYSIGLWHDRVYNSTTMWCHSYVCWLFFRPLTSSICLPWT